MVCDYHLYKYMAELPLELRAAIAAWLSLRQQTQQPCHDLLQTTAVMMIGTSSCTAIPRFAKLSSHLSWNQAWYELNPMSQQHRM